MKGKINIFKHSIWGLISGLIFLVPIFPIFTLLPIVGLAWVLGECFSDCVIGYKIAYILSLILALILDFLYLRKVVRKNTTETSGFGLSFCFNLFLYLLVNAFVFVAFVGTQAACYGDGQVILGAIYSGPISSIVIFVNGLIIDLVKWLKTNKIEE